jgi:hypothetical protein
MKIGGNLLARLPKTAIVLRDGLQFRAHLVAGIPVLQGYLNVGSVSDLLQIRAISAGFAPWRTLL